MLRSVFKVCVLEYGCAHILGVRCTFCSHPICVSVHPVCTCTLCMNAVYVRTAFMSVYSVHAACVHVHVCVSVCCVHAVSSLCSSQRMSACRRAGAQLGGLPFPGGFSCLSPMDGTAAPMHRYKRLSWSSKEPAHVQEHARILHWHEGQNRLT